MAGRINDDDVAAVRERASIVAVAGAYTSLQRAGSGRFKGLCPFHDEKTPSFTVHAERNLYHCFGCDAGGDVVSLVMNLEGLSFPEAIEKLAAVAGVQLRYEELRPGQRAQLGRRTRLVAVLDAAATFFTDALASDDGAAARGYLHGRGLDDATLEAFRLGWAPDRWDALTDHLRRSGHAEGDLIEAGLATQGRHGPVDRFRGRVIFPILDHTGREVIAFGGRVLPGVELQTWSREDPPPKYINSPESPVYAKAKTLYALNWARREVVNRSEVLVVEGYMDVIGLHTVGFRNVVATCGTALTADHLAQLERFASRVTLALDADDAGFRAADRARELAAEAGIRDVAVLPLPAGQDPADLARSGGAAAVAAALEQRKTALEFQLEQLLREAATDTPEARAEAYGRALQLLRRIDDRALRYTYVRDVVAPAVGLPSHRIEEELDASASARLPARGLPPAPRSADAGRRDPQVRLEVEVLQIAVQDVQLFGERWQEVAADDFTNPACRTVFEALRGHGSDLQAVLDALPDDALRQRVRALAVDELRIDSPRNAQQALASLKEARRQREVERVQARLREGGDRLDAQETAALLARLRDLRRSDVA